MMDCRPDGLELLNLLADDDYSEPQLPIHEQEEEREEREEEEEEEEHHIRQRHHFLSERLRWIWETRPRESLRATTSKTLHKLVLLLVPSFLQPSYKYSTKLHPTSWLNGLRGFAALFVYTYHFNHAWWPTLELGYASRSDAYSFFQLPLVRVTNTAGAGMVCLFFVISGYVLSYSALRHIRDRHSVALFDTLVSSSFRRWFRLFLPILVSTFVTMLIARCGWWLNLPPVSGPARRGTFLQQLNEWWRDFLNTSNPTASFEPAHFYFPRYGPQLWTIPREFRGSMVIYLVLLCLAKTREVVRIAFSIFFCWYTFWIQQWELSLFLFGMLLADLEFLRQDFFKDEDYSSLQRYVPRLIFEHSHIFLNTISILLAVTGLDILCIPSNPRETPTYRFIWESTPFGYGGPIRFWLCIGAGLFIFSICLTPSSKSGPALLQRPFRTPFAQYLGQISFGLYVTHYQILGTIGSRIAYRWSDGVVMPYIVAYFLSLIINTFLCFWIADLFWRSVDTNSLLLAKWIAEKCFIRE